MPRASDAELVLAELLELAPGGVEERDVGGDVVEYAIYGAPGELPDLPDAARRRRATRWSRSSPSEVARRLGRALEGLPPAGARRRPAAACARRGRRRAPARIDLVIDPGQAFGTGAHHTTRLCLELLLELEPGGALVDLGCGSGVLAIAAARLGWAPVLGVDHEPSRVQADARQRGAPTACRGAGAPLRPAARRAGPVGADRAGQPAAPAAARVAPASPARARRLIATGLLAARGRRGRRRVRPPRPARARAPPRRRVGRAAAAPLTCGAVRPRRGSSD